MLGTVIGADGEELEEEDEHGDRGQERAKREGRSGSAWSAAGRAPSSAPCTASPRGSTTSSSWSPARLSSDPARAKASAAELGLDPERSYGSFEEMAKAEAKRQDGIEAVAIVTPNHMHFGPAKAFLEAGIHVICDKPLTSTLADAKKLAALVEKSGKVFVLTHNYTGYPMVRQAREMVAEGRARQDPGRAGRISAGLADDQHRGDAARSRRRGAPIRSSRAPAARPATSARTPTIWPASSPASSSIRLPPISTASSRAGSSTTMRNIMLRFQGGAKGMIWASQVAPGNENGLKLRVYGEKGGLEWTQADPNYLWYTPFGEPKRLLTRAGAGAGPAAGRVTRVPSGHPEGYLEGFANIYARRRRAPSARRARRAASRPKDVIFPTVQDGVEGVAFVEACVKSSKKNGAWTKL